MASTIFVITIHGDVFTLRVWIGDHLVPMIPTGKTWTGKQTIDAVGDSILLTVRFVAVQFTDWNISVDTTGNLLTAKGTSAATLFSYSKLMPLKAPAAPSRPSKKR